MPLFSVCTTLKNERDGKGNTLAFVLDLPFADVPAVCDALTAGRFIVGEKIRFTDDGRGGKLITGREPMGISPDHVATVSLPHFRFWEPDE